MKNQENDLYKLGSDCLDQRKYIDAEYQFNQVIKLDNDYNDAWYYLGILYLYF